MITKLSFPVSCSLFLEFLLYSWRFPLRLISPSVRSEVGVTPFHHYYDASDFLATLLISSLLRLVDQYSPPCKSSSGSPTFNEHLFMHAMLSDPEDAATPCPLALIAVLLSLDLTRWAISNTCLDGALSLQPPAYGLHNPLSTLSVARYRTSPKTRFRVCRVGTSRAAFQLLGIHHFRGAPSLN